MPPFLRVFMEPVTDPQAQVAICGLMFLALLDMVFGVTEAVAISHDFSSHKLREGLVRKLTNLGMVAAADIVDGMLLGGLELGFQPVLMVVCVSLIVMELASLLEIYAKVHPEMTDAVWYQMLAKSKGEKTGA